MGTRNAGTDVLPSGALGKRKREPREVLCNHCHGESHTEEFCPRIENESTRFFRGRGFGFLGDRRDSRNEDERGDRGSRNRNSQHRDRDGGGHFGNRRFDPPRPPRKRSRSGHRGNQR